jgi:sporulation protein YlmC with PRC-barrel domain
MTHFGLFGAGMAAAYVVGTERRVLKEKDTSRVINGVSAKRQVLGQKVFNDQGEMVGKIDDLILTKKVVTHAIVGAGGFLGLGTHDVAISADKFLRDDDRIVLPDASKEALQGATGYTYDRTKRVWMPATKQSG